MHSFNSPGQQSPLWVTSLSCFMKSFTILSLFFILHSCALSTERHSRYTGGNYEDVFRAAIQAVHDIDFSVVTSDVNSGRIVAEKSVLDNEKGVITRRLNIAVESTPGGIKVGITFDDQPVAIEDDKKPVREFVEALKKRAPVHLSVSSINNWFFRLTKVSVKK